MKRVFWTLCFLFFAICCFAQSEKKRLIDSTTYGRWPSLGSPIISNDGRYTAYEIQNEPVQNCTLVLKENSGDWEERFIGVRYAVFSADSKNAILIDTTNALCIVKLGERAINKIADVSYFNLPSNGDGEWIGYRSNKSNDITIMNIRTERKRSLSSVGSFSFSKDGKVLLYVIDSMNHQPNQQLKRLHLSSGVEEIVWSGIGLEDMILNQDASRVALMIEGTNGSKEIWYYQKRKGRAELLVSDESFSGWEGFVLSRISRMSADGRYLFLTLVKLHKTDFKRKGNSTVNVWSYLDNKLQSAQLQDGDPDQFSSVAVDVVSHHITCLSKSNEFVISSSAADKVHLVESVLGDGDRTESSWNKKALITYAVKSSDGKIDIPLKLEGVHIVSVSPGGRYIIYFDNTNKSYYSFEVPSGIYRKITGDINTSWIDCYRDDAGEVPRGIAAWVDNDYAVLLYDRFDIWMIDPAGNRKPISITGGYGKQHDIIFFLAMQENSKGLSRGKTVLLNALDINTKKNGFYKVVIGRPGMPEKLTMGNYIYKLVGNPYIDQSGIYPVKAALRDVYIVSRMSATEYPNYFYTANFIDFKPISFLSPEKLYNWYTTELHSWRTDDGKILQGILYKPEDFDSNKVYPVIFQYYERKSFGLNEYLTPSDLTGGCDLNIPTYVSNGYIVFAPDIAYVIGNPMAGTLSALTSAARYVKYFPYVNKRKLGIGGCSFGGIQTNYLITHTNIFTAAYSSSGMSDLVSAYGIIVGGRSNQSFFEYGGQGRMGGTLWQAPEQYIGNSAIFNADKVVTPLLLMHTTKDAMSSFLQATEFFTALRRLGKRVWLLEYTDGNHGISGKSARDFNIRLKQFFDHYLRDLPAPKWMTRGVPAEMKDIDNGLELDYRIKTPAAIETE
ncbi:alpha/beta hydrolase family protein [Chitinophaga sp. Ak27]|uniref:alpha/beta hydrolase family protein n=1 Tax=Chitinophaga sp. Ak27 TaxID=2726116 RepID=UPI00145E7168|nr:prolyl oligopeptidase family serine peptidase [Chitinophaga sp. Ak27]NLU95760.1 S9 family peptidase [Chitinophaga sp. Ak27]